MDSRFRAPSSAAAFALGFLVFLAPVAARAQAGVQTAQDRASARVLAEEADRKMTKGDYAGAAESFTKAYTFVPAPTIKVARAHAYLKLALLIEAQQDLFDAARSEPQPGEPASWGDARVKARAEADSITPRLPLITLGITGAPLDRVTFTVDGQPVAVATLGSPRAVNPGAHTVKAQADGYVPAEQALTLVEGEHKAVTFALTPAAGGAIGGVVGTPLETAPPSAPAPSPPPILYTPAPTYAPVQMTSLPRPEQPNNTVSTLGWVGTGVFGGTGLATGAIALALAMDVKNHCNGNVCPTSSQSEANTSSTLGNVSTVTLILGGGCLLLGIFTHHSAPRQTALQPSFDVVLGPGSLGAVGRF